MQSADDIWQVSVICCPGCIIRSAMLQDLPLSVMIQSTDACCRNASIYPMLSARLLYILRLKAGSRLTGPDAFHAAAR